MKSTRAYYSRNLPHYQPDGYAFFITFRLYGTLPAEIVNQFKSIKENGLEIISGYDDLKTRNEKYEELKVRYFKLYDDYLDKCGTSNCWLKLRKTAYIVKEAIHYRDGKEYELISYTIMPNHIHLVFIPLVERFTESLSPVERFDESLPKGSERNTVPVEPQGRSVYRVTSILQNLKKNTAIKCNKVLYRTGAFWQHESYDHVVRNADELKRIVNYVFNNPVKAGLAEYPEQWDYSYVNYDLIPVL